MQIVTLLIHWFYCLFVYVFEEEYLSIRTSESGANKDFWKVVDVFFFNDSSKYSVQECGGYCCTKPTYISKVSFVS